MTIGKIALKFNTVFIYLIMIYRYSLSPILGRSCRFYPTCSEYSIWQFENRSFLIALYYTIKRVLKCNPLCDGGIDYPVVVFKKEQNLLFREISKSKVLEIRYWLVPIDEKKAKKRQENSKFFLIKSFKI